MKRIEENVRFVSNLEKVISGLTPFDRDLNLMITAVALLDISKSLAIIADKYEEELKKRLEGEE